MSALQVETSRRSRADHHPRWSSGYIEVDPKFCEACGECVEVCRREVLRVVGFLVHKHVRVRHPEKCRGCGKCAAACSNGAIVLRERAYEEGRAASLIDTANVGSSREISDVGNVGVTRRGRYAEKAGFGPPAWFAQHDGSGLLRRAMR